MTSDSLIASPLKCLRTDSAKLCFPTLRFSPLFNMVGECRPMPGAERMAAFRWFLKAVGVGRRYVARYPCRSEIFSEDQLSCSFAVRDSIV